MVIKLSQHAQERWAERCSGMTLPQSINSLRRLTKAQRKRMKQTCPMNYNFYMRDGASGRYARIDRSGIVYILSNDDTVITVLIDEVTS